MRVHEWLACEEQERAVRIEYPFGDVHRRVFVGRTRLIDRAGGEAIHQQYRVTRGHGALRCGLDHRFGQPGAAMKCDERRKGTIPIRLCKKAAEPIAWYDLGSLPTLASMALL